MKENETKIFLKGDETNSSYSLHETKIINDRIPSYHINALSERYNEALLQLTKLTSKKKRRRYEKNKHHLDQIKMS